MLPFIAGTLVAGYNGDGSFELYSIEPAGTVTLSFKLSRSPEIFIAIGIVIESKVIVVSHSNIAHGVGGGMIVLNLKEVNHCGGGASIIVSNGGGRLGK